MPNTDRLQPDFNQEPDDGNESRSLSREIDSLQRGIRVDFDQKLGELADLLARFKAMVISPGETHDIEAANDDAAQVEVQKTIPLHPENVVGTTKAEAPEDTSVTEDDITDVADFTPPEPGYYAETARFENGLYKLNSQLYRFRLELDQEMEFREEPLHTHFRKESELSVILQKLSDRSSEKPG